MPKDRSLCCRVCRTERKTSLSTHLLQKLPLYLEGFFLMTETAGVLLIQELTSTLPGSTLEPALSTSVSLTKPRASCRSLPQDSGFHKVLLYRAGQSKENIKKPGSHLGLGRGSNKSELLCHERTANESRSAVRNPRCLLTASSKAGCL